MWNLYFPTKQAASHLYARPLKSAPDLGADMLDVVFLGTGLVFFATGNMEDKEMRFGIALMAGR